MSATILPVISAGPPAANGTMIVTVLAGYSWACALSIPAIIRSTAAAIKCFATYRLPDIIIVVTICWFCRRASLVGGVSAHTNELVRSVLWLQAWVQFSSGFRFVFWNSEVAKLLEGGRF